MDIPFIKQVKIQAQMLVPLVKTLRTELGEEQTHALVRKALGDYFRKFGHNWWQQLGSSSLGEKMDTAWEAFSSGEALDYEILKKSPEAYEVNVTGCRYAKFYKELGEPELGFLLVCSQDFPMTEGFGSGIQLTRTQTIMQGASHCDFRYLLKKEQEERQK
jgi:hypothetical protein